MVLGTCRIAPLRLLPIALALLAWFSAPARAQAPATLFVDVNIVPMDRERVVRRQSVLVESGRIAAIGERLEAPAGARRVDGQGRLWLLPGLADMHVHADTREEMAVMLAAGITTALDMGEARNSFVGRTRAAMARGDVPGPRMLAALAVDGSPQYGHLVVPTPDAARWAVGLAKANGYEFIKVYNGLAPGVFRALVAEARTAGLPVVGHSVVGVGLEAQAAAGQVMFAHLEEFLYAFFRMPEGALPLAAPDEAEIPRAIEFLRRSGATVTADLVTFQTIARQWGRPDIVAGWLAAPEIRHLAPDLRIAWAASGYARRTGSLDDRAAFLARFVDALAEAGVPLVAGTDAPSIPGLFPGDALHDNLDALVAAGLSRFEALATATREPGRFLRRALPEAPQSGTVSEGARADLLLVAANPLDDLTVLRRPLGVMANGRWHTRADLDALLGGVAQTYAAAAHCPCPAGSDAAEPAL